MMKKLTLIAGLLLAGFTTQAQPKQEDYYNFTRIPLPENVVLEAGGIAMLPNGNLAVSTRRGDIYTVSNPLGKAEDMKMMAGLFGEVLSVERGVAVLKAHVPSGAAQVHASRVRVLPIDALCRLDAEEEPVVLS